MWGCLECACFVGGTVRKPLEGSLEACLSPAAVMVTAVRGMAERGLGTRFSKMKELPLLSVSHLSLQSGPHSLLTSRQLLALAKASSVFHGARSSDRTPSTALDAVITLCSLIAGLSQLQDTALAGFLLLLHPCSSAPWPRARVVLGLIFGPLAFLFILPLWSHPVSLSFKHHQFAIDPKLCLRLQTCLSGCCSGSPLACLKHVSNIHDQNSSWGSPPTWPFSWSFSWSSQ